MPPSAAEAQAALAKKREARAKRAAGSKPRSGGSKAEPTPHRQLVDALRQLEKECGRDEEGKARLASALGLLLFVTDTLIDANAKKDTASGRLIRVDDSFNMRLGRLEAHKPCMEALGFSLVAQRGRKMYVAGKTAASLRRLKDVELSKELIHLVAGGSRMAVQKRLTELEAAGSKRGPDAECMLHVGGVEGPVEDEAALEELFRRYGTVSAVTLRRRREGKKVSWALITFAAAESVGKAIDGLSTLAGRSALGAEGLVVRAVDMDQAAKSTGAMKGVMKSHKFTALAEKRRKQRLAAEAQQAQQAEEGSAAPREPGQKSLAELAKQRKAEKAKAAKAAAAAGEGPTGTEALLRGIESAARKSAHSNKFVKHRLQGLSGGRKLQLQAEPEPAGAPPPPPGPPPPPPLGIPAAPPQGPTPPRSALLRQIESSGFRGETYSSPAQHGMMDPEAFRAELAQHAKSFGGPLAALGELESGGDNAHAALLAEIVQRRTGTPSPSKRIEEMHPAALLREIEAVVSHCQSPNSATTVVSADAWAVQSSQRQRCGQGQRRSPPSPKRVGFADDAFKAELAQRASSVGGPLAALGQLEAGEGNAQSALLREIEAAGRTRTKYEASAEQVSDYRSRLSIEVARVSEGPSVNDELTASLRVIQHYPFHAAIQEASWSAVWAIIARLKTSAGGSPSLSPQLGAGLLESAAGALQRNISPSATHAAWGAVWAILHGDDTTLLGEAQQRGLGAAAESTVRSGAARETQLLAGRVLGLMG